MRIIIEGFGRRLVDLELLPPRTPAGAPGTDPAGTIASHVEQASEPAPGFGFAGSVRTLKSRDGGAQ